MMRGFHSFIPMRQSSYEAELLDLATAVYFQYWLQLKHNETNLIWWETTESKIINDNLFCKSSTKCLPTIVAVIDMIRCFLYAHLDLLVLCCFLNFYSKMWHMHRRRLHRDYGAVAPQSEIRGWRRTDCLLPHLFNASLTRGAILAQYALDTIWWEPAEPAVLSQTP